MEDVLEIYKQPYDPLRPVICFDETSRQLIEERHIPVNRPGQVDLVDYEYRRCGVANLFMIFEPLAAKRFVKVTDTRTRVDFAHCVKELADTYYPYAETASTSSELEEKPNRSRLASSSLIVSADRDGRTGV